MQGFSFVGNLMDKSKELCQKRRSCALNLAEEVSRLAE